MALHAFYSTCRQHAYVMQCVDSKIQGKFSDAVSVYDFWTSTTEFTPQDNTDNLFTATRKQKKL